MEGLLPSSIIAARPILAVTRHIIGAMDPDDAFASDDGSCTYGLWQPTIDSIRQITYPRGVDDFKTADPDGRSTAAILAELVADGALIQPSAVTQLPNDFNPPESVSAERVFELLEHFAKDKDKYLMKKGIGAREVKSKKTQAKGGTKKKKSANTEKVVTHIIYQLGRPDLDGGLLNALKDMRRSLLALLENGKRLSDKALDRLIVANSLLKFMKHTAGRFKKEHATKGNYWHLVFYVNPAKASMSVHTDSRLKSALSQRAIFLAPSLGVDLENNDEERLSFYVAQQAPYFAVGDKKKTNPMLNPRQDHAGLDIRGARTLGAMGGNVLMTGVGAGGVEIIPPGIVDLSGNWGGAANAPAVYLWHLPYAQGYKYGYGGMRASYVFSGSKRKHSE